MKSLNILLLNIILVSLCASQWKRYYKSRTKACGIFKNIGYIKQVKEPEGEGCL